MKKVASDWAWEQYGKKDPYYGVCTKEVFRAQNLTEDAKRDFFETGFDHVEKVMETVRDLRKDFSPLTVLDFGCGTGRLLIPFSKVAKKVTGIDVSEQMLHEAEKNLKSFGIDNAELIIGNSLDPVSTKKFDFVHSFIVLQHISTSNGYEILKSLISAVAPGGVGAIHITFSNKQSSFKKLKTRLRSRYRWIAQLSNVLSLRHPNHPEMQMNNYELEHVFSFLNSVGINTFKIKLTNHGGFLGTFLFFTRDHETDQVTF